MKWVVKLQNLLNCVFLDKACQGGLGADSPILTNGSGGFPVSHGVVSQVTRNDIVIWLESLTTDSTTLSPDSGIVSWVSNIFLASWTPSNLLAHDIVKSIQFLLLDVLQLYMLECSHKSWWVYSHRNVPLCTLALHFHYSFPYCMRKCNGKNRSLPPLSLFLSLLPFALSFTGCQLWASLRGRSWTPEETPLWRWTCAQRKVISLMPVCKAEHHTTQRELRLAKSYDKFYRGPPSPLSLSLRTFQGCSAQWSVHRYLWGSRAEGWRQEPLQGQRFVCVLALASPRISNAGVNRLMFVPPSPSSLLSAFFLCSRCAQGSGPHQWHSGSCPHSNGELGTVFCQLGDSAHVLVWVHIDLQITITSRWTFRKLSGCDWPIQTGVDKRMCQDGPRTVEGKKGNVFYGHKHQIGAVKWGCVGMSDLRVRSNCSLCVSMN